MSIIHTSSELYYLYLFACSIGIHMLNWFGFAGTKAIIWTPQVKGVPSLDPHPAKQTEICSNIQRSYCHLDAASCSC